MRALTVAVLLILFWGCAEKESNSVEECIELIDMSLECVDKKTLDEARADDPNNVFLQRQTEEEWSRYSMCKTRARDRWSESQKQELDECRAFLKDYYEKRKEAEQQTPPPR